MEDSAAEAYDYLILGAGTAGCVLASRLSENADVTVCLIEAGAPDRHPFIHVPAAVAAAIATPSLNWGFQTVPQPGLNGRRIPLPRGRGIGGSNSINGMVYHRGHPKDFDDWAAAGNVGWSYAEVLPYFLRAENNEAFPGSPYHHRGGPMNVIDIKRPNPLNAAFLAAMASLEFRRCPDFTGADPEGYGPRQATIRNGRRESTATAYLRPARRRQNLRVLTDARVTRIQVDQRRASGVDILAAGAPRRLAARREVILCGGSIQSPQILQLSGIGDGRALQALGIPVEHHLPEVGANLRDHLAAPVLMETRNSESYGISLRAAPRGLWNILEYAVARRGPLGSNVFEANAFLRSTSGLDRPDIQVVFQPARRNRGTFPLPLGHGFAINTVNLYPRSHGRITLASPDPLAAPLIDPNLLEEPQDLQPLLRGIVLARRILGTPAFARYRAVEVEPGPAVQGDEALAEFVRRAASTVHHPVSTCRMGPDNASVVDPQLRVRGIDGLRVVDASIFPNIVGGNTNAVIVMVAEKAADMILGRPVAKPLEPPTTASAVAR
ncbi:MAG TPA: GMC family oxidoreductase N-terminal domain-containing protein [Steroidobacteraceae bacterium]